MFGLQNKSVALEIILEIQKSFITYYQDNITDFEVENYTDYPHIEFTIVFLVYNYFHISLVYDRDCFGCSIINGEKRIHIKSSQKWYKNSDIDVFLREFDYQIRLRIPDKFLKVSEVTDKV